MEYPKLLQKAKKLPGSIVATLVVSLSVIVTAAAADPSPFTAEYQARYGGFKASAERSLEHAEDGSLQMFTSLQLKFFGKTISRIRESSILENDTDTGEWRPLAYNFEQSGIGSRKRNITFDWESTTATTVIGRNENIIALEGTAMDNLSGYLALREQLLAGKQEVLFQGIDKGELKEFHYRVIGEEPLETDAGNFNALKLERVRDATSRRTTEIWLAPHWDYLLLKLVQKEPGSNTISLELTSATVAGQTVEPGKNG